MKKKLFFLFLLSFLVRLISLNQSLWLDEATTARVVKEYGFTQIVTQFSPSDFHPPLYYLLMKLWTNVFGYSEVSLRMPSVLFSLLTGYLVYLIGIKIDSGQARMTKNMNVGVWSAIFFLFNPLIVYYSQEARMYIMTTFFLTLSIYYFIDSSPKIFPQENSSPPVGGSSNILFRQNFGSSSYLFALCISLSFLTFYGSIFLIIPMFLYLIYKKQYKIFLFSFLILTSLFLILTPLLLQQFTNAKQSLVALPRWSNVLGQANLRNLALIPIKFSIGRISFYPKWLYWGISAIWTLFIWFFAFKGGLKNKFLLFLFLGSLGFGILFSLFTPLLQYFRFLYLIPIMSLLLTLGIGVSMYPPVGRAGRYIIIFGFMAFSLVYIFNPNFHREDWRSLAQSLPENRNIYIVYSSSDPLQYYRKDIKITDLKLISQKPLMDKRIIVSPYTADIHGIYYQDHLTEYGYKKISTKFFRGLSYEMWEIK